jgi:hypothetical protein
VGAGARHVYMTSTAFTSFVRDAERLVDDPHAIADRLRLLLREDGWLAPEHRRASGDGYRQHLLHVSEDRRLSVVALVWLPGIGRCIETIALARIAWVLHLALNSALDLRRVVPLALRATGNDYYTRHTDSIVADVAAGHPLHLAFHRSGAFPMTFIDALAVAEESGQVVASMDRLSSRYEEEAEMALKALAVIAGCVVWALVAAVIVFLIFRLAGFYFGTIQDAVNRTR